MNTFAVPCVHISRSISLSLSVCLLLSLPTSSSLPVRVLMFVELFGFVVMLIKSIIAQLCRRHGRACGQQVPTAGPSSQASWASLVSLGLGSWVLGLGYWVYQVPGVRAGWSEDLNTTTITS